MTSTNVDALKELCAAIATKAGESVSPADVPGDTSADVIKRITKAYKGESIFDTEKLAALTLSSAAGATLGTTKVTVEGAIGSSGFKYKATTQLPNYGDELTGWTTWDGSSDITADDSTTIAICEVDENGLAIAGGTVFVNANLG